MNNTFQLIIAFVVFLAVGIAVAVGVGTGDYILPIAIGLGAFAMVLVSTVGRHLPLDVTIICLGVGAFYIAGKGFAYLNVGGLFFVGEALLLLGMLGYLWRVGKGRITLVPRTPMAIALLVLGLYALIRLPYDFRTYGLMAMRDACVIYYTIFFFIAYQAGQDPKVQRMAPTILIAMALPGMLIDFMGLIAPGVVRLLASFTIRGNPLILNHYDAIHPAAFGMILFLASKAISRQGINIFYFLGMFIVSAYVLAIGRGANYLAFAALGMFLLLARQFALLVGMAGGVVLMLCALLVMIEINPSVGRDRLRQIEDQLEVMVDPSKIAEGKTTDADTADWRLKWWQKITRDVNRASPIFGFGFGYDIASDFHREFFRVATVNPEIGRTRGAHNAFFTVLARMGWLGALCFLGVVAVQLWYFGRAVLAFREGLIPPSQAFFWGSNICAFVITFFQYAWEAPYSAIPAWTCMGLSYAYLDGLRKPKLEIEVEEPEPAALPQPRRAPVPRVAHPSAS